jgi:GntR family transcriptional regulator
MVAGKAPAPGPRYLEIAEILRAEVEALPPNSLLPTEHQLAHRFGVSRLTIRRTLGLLERSGLVSRHRGRGTIVSPPKIVRRFSPLFTFEEDLREQGIKFDTRVVEYQRKAKPPDVIRERLRLRPGASVGCVSLARIVDDRIIAHDRRYFPASVAVQFDPVMVQDRPMSQILGEIAARPITAVDWESEIMPAPREVARVLGLTPGALIVANTFTYYLETGAPIEAGIMAYRIDRCKFVFAGRFGTPVLWKPPDREESGQVDIRARRAMGRDAKERRA